MSRAVVADDCYVICPHCGYKHGDAWEMFQMADTEREFTCNGCEVSFTCWAVARTTYFSRSKDSR